MGVTGGLIALAVALLAATAFGLWWQRRSGRFRPGRPASAAAVAAPVTAGRPQGETLTEADLGAGLGRRATLVQFSTAFCAPCRPTRQILAQVADMVDGVTHVEIDAAERLDLTRRFRVNSAPTILVLDPDGVVVKRAVGLPRKADVIAALGAVIPDRVPDGSTE
jgi:thiol-disulfide isomerase/thioredoxin